MVDHKIRKINKILKKLISISLFFLILSLSYAYFTANITGSETGTTVTVSGGKMYMNFDGGNNISVSNIYPQEAAWVAKTFTVTGNNTTDLNMGYSLYLEVDENTFSQYALHYKLTSTNTGNNGTVVAGNQDSIPIKSGASSTLLGYGTYSSPTSADKVHTYTLEIYFPNMNFNQNENQEKIFGAHLEIRDYTIADDRIMSSLDIVQKAKQVEKNWYYSKMTNNSTYGTLGDQLASEIGSSPFLNTTIARNKIESIEFVNTNVIPGGVLGSFDISEKQNGSVKLWYETGIDPTLYKVTIGQQGGVKAPIHADCIFSYLTKLNTLSGNLNTSATTTMSFMFYGAGFNATTFTLGNLSSWDTSNVTDMSHIFNQTGRYSTTWSIGDLSSWDTSNVTDMSYMFRSAGRDATTFTLGDLSSWDTSKVTTISYMFYYAGDSATTWSIGDLSSWDTSNVTNMSWMFYYAGYTATTWSIGDLSLWDTSNVTDMSIMFMYAGYTAPTFTLGNLSSWDTSKVTDMSFMFCTAGRNATTWSIGDLSSWDTSNVTNMSHTFYYAGSNATTWSIGDLSLWNTSKVTTMKYMFMYAGYTATTFTLGDLSSWDTSNVTDMKYMFYYAGYTAPTFTLGNLSSWDTSKVTDMSYMFDGTGQNATTWSIGDLSSWDTSNITTMTYMFYNAGYTATTFTLGDLSSWDTSNVTDMSGMFAGAGYNATTWFIGNISNWNTSNLSYSRCDSLYGLGSQATTALAPVITAWGCN